MKITTFLTDIQYREELVPIREEFFGKKTPAATQVAVSALGRPEWLIESRLSRCCSTKGG